MEQILKIATYVLDSITHIWPYLFITIPLAVVVQASGAARYIHQALSRKPAVSVLLATVVGALSPFCSCGVIPVIASLLMGGVPLAPVMSFWIASPSMDPEIFFLSAATIGLNLSVWRLVATFVISLSAGYITLVASRRGWLGTQILRTEKGAASQQTAGAFLSKVKAVLSGRAGLTGAVVEMPAKTPGAGYQTVRANVACCQPVNEPDRQQHISQAGASGCQSCTSGQAIQVSKGKMLLTETISATLMVLKFMSLAFFINALISFYVPKDFLTDLLGGTGAISVVIATLVGIPAYTSNLTALPVISGLLALGMNKGAALAFLIAGPVTTLPAMAAVWGIVNRRVFMLYLACSLVGALLFGFLYNFI